MDKAVREKRVGKDTTL